MEKFACTPRFPSVFLLNISPPRWRRGAIDIYFRNFNFTSKCSKGDAANEAVAGEIILALMSGAKTFPEIQKSTKLSPSIISKYLDLLASKKVISSKGDRHKREYCVADHDEARKLLMALVESVEILVRYSNESISGRLLP